MAIPSEKDLLAAACHFGHRKDKWNPRNAPYIFAVRKNIHIFDLGTTKQMLAEMCEDMKALNAMGKSILFVSTKQQSTALLEEVGKALNQPTVTKKWIPGLLTNWDTIKKRIKYYLDLQKSFQSGEVDKYTKKEQTHLRKQLTKLDAALSGVAHMTGRPDAVFIVDGVLDKVALLEARKLKIPVYGICDSNADPTLFTKFVPANDDAVKSIAIILTTVTEELGGSISGEQASPAADELVEENDMAEAA